MDSGSRPSVIKPSDLESTDDCTDFSDYRRFWCTVTVFVGAVCLTVRSSRLVLKMCTIEFWITVDLYMHQATLNPKLKPNSLNPHTASDRPGEAEETPPSRHKLPGV